MLYIPMKMANKSITGLSNTIKDKQIKEGGISMFERYGDVITARELMDILNVGKNKVYKLLADGDIKAVRIGKNWRILLTDVQAHFGYSPKPTKTRFTV